MHVRALPLLLVEAKIEPGDRCQVLALGLRLSEKHLLVLDLLLLENSLLLFHVARLALQLVL